MARDVNIGVNVDAKSGISDIHRLEASFNSLSVKMGSANSILRTLKSNSKSSGAAFKDLSRQIKQTNGILVSGFNANIDAIESMEKALSKNNKTVKNAVKQQNTFGNALKSVKAAIIGYVTVLSTMKVIDFTTGIVSAGVELDSLQRTLKAVTGNTQQASDEFEFIQSVAKKYSLSIKALEQNYKGLIASTQDTALEGAETKRLFDAMSGTAAVLSMRTDDVTGAFRAFVQMVSKGNVQAEELRGQLGERLYGAFNLAAKAMNVSTEELNDMLKRGDVLAKDLIPRIVDVLENKYGPAMDGVGERSEAAFIRLENAIYNLQRAISESGVLEFISKLADKVTELTNAASAGIKLLKNDDVKSIKGFDEAIVKAEKDLKDFQSLWGPSKSYIPKNLHKEFDMLISRLETLRAARENVLKTNTEGSPFDKSAGPDFSGYEEQHKKYLALVYSTEKSAQKLIDSSTSGKIASWKAALSVLEQSENKKPELIKAVNDEILRLEESLQKNKDKVNKKSEESYKSFIDSYKQATMDAYNYKLSIINEEYKANVKKFGDIEKAQAIHSAKLKALQTEQSDKDTKDWMDSSITWMDDMLDKEAEAAEEVKRITLGEFEYKRQQVNAYYEMLMEHTNNVVALEQERADKIKEIDAAESEDKKANLTGFSKALQEYMDSGSKSTEDLTYGISSGLLNSTTDLFTTFASGSQSAKEAFRSFAVSTLQMIAKLLIQFALLKAVQGISGYAADGGISGSGGDYTKITSSAAGGYALANGGVFSRGNITPFAVGGVVSSPTVFPMASGGTGLMGEAGAEGILPLRRTSNGRLGVESTGGGGGVNVVNNFNGDVGNEEDQKKMATQFREAMIEVYRQQQASDMRVGGAIHNYVRGGR